MVEQTVSLPPGTKITFYHPSTREIRTGIVKDEHTTYVSVKWTEPDEDGALRNMATILFKGPCCILNLPTAGNASQADSELPEQLSLFMEA